MNRSITSYKLICSSISCKSKLYLYSLITQQLLQQDSSLLFQKNRRSVTTKTESVSHKHENYIDKNVETNRQLIPTECKVVFRTLLGSQEKFDIVINKVMTAFSKLHPPSYTFPLELLLLRTTNERYIYNIYNIYNNKNSRVKDPTTQFVSLFEMEALGK